MTELELGPLRFGVVGAGRLGCIVAQSLQTQGLTLTAVSSATETGCERAARILQVAAFEDPAQVLADSDVVFLCVPDDAVAEVAANLATHIDPSTSVRIVHTSGIVPLAALEPLAATGCDVLALHPLQTITDRSAPDALRGAAAAITAADLAGRTFGHALAHALEMHPFDLPDEGRPLYHAAASLAANFTVTLQAAARELATLAGVHEGVATHAFAALARAAIDRAERDSPATALTGPITRGDVGTVRAHLAALDEHAPAVADIYRPLAQATVRLAVSAGQLDVARADAIDAAIARD